MKNKLLVLIVILCLSLAVLTSCGGIAEPANLQVNNGVLTWDAVNNAESYVVEINGVQFECGENTFAIPSNLYGQAAIKVTAVSANGSSSYAELKTVITVTLATPKNVTQQGSVITWDEVANANGYVVKINNVEYPAQTNEFTLPNNASGELSVLAAGTSDGLILSSGYSQPITIKTKLKTPSDVTVSDGVISWKAVDNADKYVVTINGALTRETTDNSLSVKYLVSGAVTVNIKAVSSNPSLLDSDVCQASLNIERYALPTPQNVAIVGKTLTFSSVEGATSYEIYLNGKLIGSVKTTSYQLTDEQISLGGYAEVRALSDNADPSKLSDKAMLGVTEISNEQQLFGLNPNGCYKLTCDIAITKQWMPIAFNGIFDGDGHKITNVIISGDGVNVGFFSALTNASVKNITVEGSVTANVSEANACIGGLAGTAVNSTVTNCNVKIDVTAKVSNGVGNVGGVFGAMQNTSAYSVTYEGKVNSDNAVTGGFVGRAYSPENVNAVENCTVKATVTCSGGEQSPCGGFVGMFTDNSLTFTDCIAEAEVAGGVYVGGFVGYMGSGRLNNCSAKGSVTSSNGTLSHVGGFIGRLEGYNNVVSNCEAVCSVRYSDGNNVYAGGFVGHTVGGSYASVYTDCTYDKSVCSLDRIGNPANGKGDGISAING